MLRNQAGNIFFAIFGAVALVGVLTAGVATFVKGPLATSVKITRQNTAENQMSIAGQVAVMAAANTASSGDCDADGFVEPIEWREDLTKPFPVGGGLIPSTIGISKKDPWGNEYGYCVWDHGPSTNGSGTCGGGMQKRLSGTNSKIYSAVALVSAGPDKTFTTTCRTFDDADVNSDGDLETAGVDLPLVGKANPEDDDIIFTYTYEEATGASGGLWSLKSGDPGTAVINKKLETQGSASFAGGVLLPDSALITCDATTAGVMARNASGDGISICDGAGSWANISGGGATTAFDPNATCTVPADAGKVRYNSVSGQPEFCDGATWRGFTLASQVANLVFTPPQQNSMNVDGGNNLDTTACTVVSGYSCGAGYPFVLQNQGGGVSGTISVSLSNSTNFVKTADTCTGQTLDPNESCSITIKPKANGNMGFTGNLQISANNNPFALMQGVSTNFGCYPGRSGPGGIYAGCGIAAPDGTYDLVIIPGGCTGSTNNPTCTGGNDTGAVARTYGAANINLPSVSMGASPSGAQQHQNIMAYVNMTGTVMGAAQYCDAMVYQGYSDWFLPSDTEWAYVSTAFSAGLIPFVYAAYKLSDQHSDYSYGLSKEWVSQPGSPYYRNDWRTNSQPVRCVRREALPLPSAVADTDPDEVGIAPTVLFSASAQGTSNAVRITGIMQPITVSITGGTGMDILRNGTAMGTTSLSNVKINDTIAFRMTGPAVMGTKANATIQIGSDSYTWWVGYADSSRTAKIFVTSTTYTQGSYSGGGNGSGLGGLPGANNVCSVRAGASPYGLSGSWKWVGSNTSVNAVDNIPWNWGTLKDVLGNTIVTGGITDLFDGSLALPIRYSELGTPQSTAVFTSTRTTGTKATSTLDAGGALSTCNDMLGVPYYGQYVIVGNAQSSAGNWIESAWSYCNSSQYAIYCIENVDDTSDVTPAPIDLSYVVQAALSSRQLSPTVVIGGMSNGASATLSVSATGGNPKFTLNGGAEVSSATVTNGDSVVFLLDAPATASTSNKMTITANGSSTLGYWRVWSGWDGVGSGIKRIFVTSTDPNGAGFGGVAGADPVCQSRAVAAGLGGTWKAILSGIVESEWAINRVGYNWNELRLVDGTTIAYAPNLWSTLLNPVIKTEFGATKASARVFSGTASNGRSYSAVSDLSNLYNWTGASCSATYMQGNTSALSIAITQGYWLCQSDGALYCIEQ